jgi:hypothetical protein
MPDPESNVDTSLTVENVNVLLPETIVSSAALVKKEPVALTDKSFIPPVKVKSYNAALAGTAYVTSVAKPSITVAYLL